MTVELISGRQGGIVVVWCAERAICLRNMFRLIWLTHAVIFSTP